MLTSVIAGSGLVRTEGERGILPPEHVMVWVRKAVDSGSSGGFLVGIKAVLWMACASAVPQCVSAQKTSMKNSYRYVLSPEFQVISRLCRSVLLEEIGASDLELAGLTWLMARNSQMHSRALWHAQSMHMCHNDISWK